VHTVQSGPLAGPANRVTLVRAVLAGVVALLVVTAYAGSAPVAAIVLLSTVTLVLDGVDGWVARHTGTTSAFGARFDLEVDAFLILVLSVYAARSVGPWVLAIGAARYVFVAARWRLAWMQGTVPPRNWCKVVAVVQGMALTTVAAGVLAPAAATVLLVVALALLAESFGREVWQLWQLDGHSGRLRDPRLLVVERRG
jgi:phosphatidylglycerophosphate synthase